MPDLLEHPVSHLLSRLSSDVPRWIIGMAGLPGAGKTTLAARLAQEINAQIAPNTMIALGMDGFHLAKAELRQFPDPDLAFARRGAPWTFDTVALAKRLHALRVAANRETVTWPDFQHDIGDPVEDAFAVPAATRLVLVEGLYLLYDQDGWDVVSNLFDERWYLDTPFDVALERLAQRHMAAWNFTREAAEHRIATNDRINAEIVFQSQSHAQWRVVSS